MKQGYKTTEFYLSFAAMLLGTVMASGLIPSDGPWLQILGLAAAALAGLGYTGARMVLKGGDRKAAATEASAAAFAEVAAEERRAGPTEG